MNRREFFNTLAVGIGAAVTTKALTPPCPAFPCAPVQPETFQVLTYKGHQVFWDDQIDAFHYFAPRHDKIVFLKHQWR